MADAALSVLEGTLISRTATQDAPFCDSAEGESSGAGQPRRGGAFS
jgi:hypothetical protein